jgi:acetyl-CoA C-acetyltransferase
MTASSPIYVVSARRTPFGRFLGSLSALSPVDLARAAGDALLEGRDRRQVDLCVLGNVLGAGHGMNISRQVALGLGLPIKTPAYTVNQMCASGMTSVHHGIHAIRSGEAGVVLCGGTESMSRAPRLLHNSRDGRKLGDMPVVDSLLKDGLIDPSSGEHMGVTAELLAERYAISREAQDEFAWRSHQKWAAANTVGTFDRERISLQELNTDEQARPDSPLEKLAKLSPAFRKPGTVTAANASGLNDGAALILLANGETCERQGWTPLARVTGWATVGCEPQTMGLGPVYAIRRLCERFGRKLEDFETVEINEAFAAQVLACIKELGLEEARVNPQGGAIAIGHPIGASGARLVAHLAHRVGAGEVRSAVASLCVGGGMGIALSLERVG